MSEWDAFPAVGSAPKQDRGTRNRNPGNLKASPWSQRQPGYVGQDSGGFAMFDTPESGEAAQVNLLRSNYAGMSPTQVVNKYAPVGPENSQESVTNYINYASRRAGIDPNQPIPDELMADFARGMREFETGQTVNMPDEDFSEFEAFDEFPADDGEIVDEFSEEIATPGSSRENPIDVTDYNQVIQAKKGDWVRLENGDLTRAAGSAVEGQTGEQRAPGIFTRTTNLVDAIGAGATAAAEQIPFLDESVAFTTGLATGEGYQAMRDRQAALKQLDNEQNRGARVAGGVAGFGTGLLAPGGALINRGGSLAGRSARSLGVGAGYGALYGAGSAEGNALERAPEALAGGVIGGITGGATPAIAQGASSVASNFLARPIGRATNFLSGGRLARGYAPEAQAERRLAVALRNDGVDPLRIRSIIDEFQSTGVTPTLLDVAQRAAPGGEAARLMRGAAMQQGPASVAAERHLERTAGGLLDNAQEMTRRLAPNAPTIPSLREQISGRISGATEGLRRVDQGSGGASVSAALNASRDAAKRAVDEAYDAARAMEPGRAMISGSDARAVQSNVLDAVTDYDMRDVPRVGRVLEGLGDTTSPSVRSLFEARSRLTNLRVSNDPVEASAAARAVRSLDGEIDRLVDDGLITGDVGAVEAWRAANAARREFGRLYEGGDLIDRLTSRTYRGGAMTNMVAPEDASSAILGGTGVRPRANASRDLERLRSMAPVAFRGVQEEAASRLVPEAGSENVAGMLDRLRQQDPVLARILIDDEAASAFRNAQQQIDSAVSDRNVVDRASRIMSMGPDEFAGVGQSPLARGVSARSIEQGIGDAKEGAVGYLNRLGTSPNRTRNLREVFGPDADRYQAGIRNLVDQMKNAQFLASSSGSQTAPRAADTILAGIASLPTSVKTGFIGLIEKAARGATLTRAERQAIVELGVSEAQMREFATMPFLSGYLTVPAAQLEGQLVGRQGGR